MITKVKDKNSRPLTIFEVEKNKGPENQGEKSLLVDKEREPKNKDNKDFLFPLRTLFS